MDARDYIKMRYEKRLRDGVEIRLGQNRSIGSFERFSKVRKLLQIFSCSFLCCFLGNVPHFFCFFFGCRVLVDV